MQILPVASGKGGVGKSLVATNLAVALSQAGKKVILADLDLGASNVHLILGLGSIEKGLGNYLTDPSINFEDLLIDTGYDNLRFLPGDAEVPEIANLKNSQKSALIRKLFAVDADYLILDLGAGTGFNIMDFFLLSGQGIIVTTPTLTATLNAYLFLKSAVFRIMNSSFKLDTAARTYLDNIRKDSTKMQKLYIPKFLEKIKEEDPHGYDDYQERISKFHPRLLLNMLEDPKDSSKATKIRRSCREYLGIDMEHLGIMYRDHLQDIALASRLPIIVYKPNSVLSQAIYRIADKLLQKDVDGGGPLDINALEESYRIADMEAIIDFETKLHDIEGLLHSGTLSKGDLIETVKIQQYELSRLKKENQLLRKKLIDASKQGYKV